MITDLDVDAKRQTILTVLAAIRAAIHKYTPTKTVGTYDRQIWRAMRDLYSGDTDVFDFIDDLVSMIDNQFERAWRQGSRDVGVDPRDWTDADIFTLAERIAAEREHILTLAEDVEAARLSGAPISSLRHRAELWANRYTDVVNEARIYFGEMQKLEWVLGPTEHCDDCLRLVGTVASAKEWDASGWKPQSSRLQCGGFRCRCQLVPTDKRRTRGGIPD